MSANDAFPSTSSALDFFKSRIFPTEEDIQIWSNLPLDILRIVLELLVLRSRVRPIHLLTLSKPIHSWLQPIIYKHIWLPKFLQLRRFRNQLTTCSPYVSQLCRYSSTLVVELESHAGTRLEDIARMLTNLHTLEISVRTESRSPYNFILLGSSRDSSGSHPLRHLRKLSINGSVIGLDFQLPIFRDITHLSLSICNFVVDGAGLRCLVNLTHLGIWIPASFDNQETSIATLVECFPSSLQVVLFDIHVLAWKHFDLLDSDSDSLPLRWFPADDALYLNPPLPQGDGDISQTPRRTYTDEDIDHLHILARIALGRIDHRLVLGSTSKLFSETNLFCDLIVQVDHSTGNFGATWPSAPGEHYWALAEEILIKRKSITYSDIMHRATSS